MDTDPNQEVSALLDALGGAPEVEATDDEVSAVEAQDDGQESSAEEQQDETTEDESPAPLVVEFDGKKWELPPGTPPELAEGVKKVADELKADYTRKSQARADEERRVKQTAQALDEFRQIAAATHDKNVELTLIKRQISQIEAIDWNSLVESNPQQAIKLQAEYTRLQNAVNNGSAELQRLAMLEKQKLDAERQRRKQELVEKAADLIPGFNAKINQELLDVVTTCGFSADEASEISDPRLLKLINLARIGAQVQKSTPKTLKKVAEAPKVIRPQAPAPKRENQSAAERLKKTGRPSELVNFL